MECKNVAPNCLAVHIMHQYFIYTCGPNGILVTQLWLWVARGNIQQNSPDGTAFALRTHAAPSGECNYYVCVYVCVCVCVCEREGDVCSLVIKVLDCGLKDLLFQSHLQLLYQEDAAE